MALTNALSVLTLAFLSGETLGPIQVTKANFFLLLISSPVSNRRYAYALSSSAQNMHTRTSIRLSLSRKVGVGGLYSPPHWSKNSWYSTPLPACCINLPSYLKTALQASDGQGNKSQFYISTPRYWLSAFTV